MQSRSRKRKWVLRSSLGSARVLRPRENGLCKAPDPTDISTNVSETRLTEELHLMREKITMLEQSRYIMGTGQIL
ncbi:hypothetical protein IFM89_013781 [Coptis chinensis]|uniref:Uncharacterized protein n=1 Tax=Coptis chinensis TaxID=261450 RepID=A0A835HM38_9MAGN|nr:hypothetical protein IFM89_013781 [Coptis chinensis]